jgi:hypothetical protein
MLSRLQGILGQAQEPQSHRRGVGLGIERGREVHDRPLQGGFGGKQPITGIGGRRSRSTRLGKGVLGIDPVL